MAIDNRFVNFCTLVKEMENGNPSLFQ